MENDTTHQDQQEREAIERDKASDRAKNNGTWEAVASHAALDFEVSQSRGDWS